MKTLLSILALFFGFALSPSCQAETAKLVMAPGEVYTVQDTAQFRVFIWRYLPGQDNVGIRQDQSDLFVESLPTGEQRAAEVRVEPRQRRIVGAFHLFFKGADYLDRFDTPEKMKRAVIESSQRFLKVTVEKEIKVEEIKNKGWYGFKTTLTDASLVGMKNLPANESRYLIRGMIRLSDKSALGFNIATNDPNSEETREVEKYIREFAKEKKN